MFNGSSNQGEKLTDCNNTISNIDYPEHVGQGTKSVTPKYQKIIFSTLLHITPHEVLTVSRNTTFHIKCIPGNNTPLHHGKMPDFANAKPPPLKKEPQKKGFQHTFIQSILSTNLVASFSGYTDTTSKRQYMTGKPKR